MRIIGDIIEYTAQHMPEVQLDLDSAVITCRKPARNQA